MTMLLTGVGGALDAAAPSPLLTGLISFWKLDEASGTRNDSVGTNHLTDNNTVTGNPGVSASTGNASQFTIVNLEFLSLADNATISCGNIDFTWAGWFYFDTAAAFQCFISKSAAGSVTDYELSFDLTSGKVRFVVKGSGALQTLLSSGTFNATTWYYVVAWHDSVAQTMNVQINNGVPTSAAHLDGCTDSASALRFGQRIGDAGSYMGGRLDAWGFWKRVLTAGERTSLYNAGSGLEYPFPGT